MALMADVPIRVTSILVGATVLLSACTLIIDGEIEGKTGQPDAGPTGPACDNTQQCLMLSDRVFDCTQECINRVCVSGRSTPDGIRCGASGDNQICVSGTCVDRGCGDGYVDRNATPPEYCDDGNDNPGDACNQDCTRSCVPPAPAVCDDGNPCNGVETCGSVSGVCVASAPLEDGTECSTRDDAPGTCQAGVCVAD